MTPASIASPSRFLRGSARACLLAALAGQWLFAIYIGWTLVWPFFVGQAATVDDSRLIVGHVAGDTPGNAMLFGHLAAAAVINIIGLLQLLPSLRRRLPAWHRWAGRIFMALALVATISGFYLTWVRGAVLNPVSTFAISLNGVLIVLAVALAWHLARQRRFDAHRRWAIRAFLLVSGVWTLRLGLMAWLLLNQGPRGNTAILDGPFDLFWGFACYLLPLAVAELYFRAERGGPLLQRTTALVLMLTALLTALGAFGAFTMMWLPRF